MTTKHFSTIYLDNSGGLVLDKLKDMDGTYINNATVMCTKFTLDGSDTDVPGVSLPLTLSYIAASNGKYRGIVPAAVGITAGQRYSIKVVADTGTLLATFNHKCVARERHSS